MGMPCLGAEYTDSASDRHRLLEGAVCPVCGRPATDCHHQPPKGMGGGSARETVAGLDGPLVRPALIGLCHGCHMRHHQRRDIEIRWDWDSDIVRWLFEDGDLAPEVYAEPSPLWKAGRWTFETPDGSFSVRRDPSGNYAKEEI